MKASRPVTLMLMSDETNLYGPRLMAYVDAQLEGRDDSPTAFAVREVGVSASQFGRWRSGEVLPRLDTIVDIAHALDRPVLEVLAHTVGAVDQLTEPTPAPAQTLEAAIVASDLREAQRDLLLDVLQSVRRFESGEPEVVTKGPRRRVKR